MIARASVLADVQRVAKRWGVLHLSSPAGALDFAAIADEAIAVVKNGSAGKDVGKSQARFCIVTKGSHLHDPTALACVAARLKAFGVGVRALHRLNGAGRKVAQALYPEADLHFREGPITNANWRLLGDRFDNDAFETIFGQRYNRALVVSAAEVMRRNRLSAEQLTEIWEGGRTPVDCDTLTQRYGVRAARFALEAAGRDTTYQWFRGPLPFGISRIGNGVMAFAMRDERIDGGAPVIVINGHVPGLRLLFEPVTWIFDVGIAQHGIQINDVRRYFAGADNRPAECEPGSLRRDAFDGLLLLGSADPVTSRFNLVHCSDGLVAGVVELNRLLPGRLQAGDLLTQTLKDGGLTEAELFGIVLADPYIRSLPSPACISELTRGLPFDECIARVRQVVPPVLGVENGHGDGVTFDLLDRALQHASVSRDPLPSGDGTPLAYPRSAIVRCSADDEALGIAALGDGKVGVLVPAGGTGGRFASYAVPESDPSRNKVLRREFVVNGRRMSSLDVRLANVRYWDRGEGDCVPVAVMGSPTNEAALSQWRDSLEEPYAKKVQVLLQHGIYRLDLDLVDDNPRRSWLDAVLRDATGKPSLKPSGGAGLLSTFVLSGLLDAWQDRGVAYVLSANGDDVGFRVDPRIVGYLEREADVDCVAVGIPQRFTVTVRGGRADRCVWGDDSGWTMDEQGVPVDGPLPPARRSYDAGGCLQKVDGDRLAVRYTSQRTTDLFSTNQFYVRVAAIRRAMANTGAADALSAVQHITARLPVGFEDKSVLLDGAGRQARQISQPLHGILSWFSRCDIATATRNLIPGVRGSYAPLKNPADARFAVLILAALHHLGDELAAP